MAAAPSVSVKLKSMKGTGTPRPPLGKPGPHDPEPQGGLVPPRPPRDKPPLVPTFGRGPRKTGLKTYGNQVGLR